MEKYILNVRFTEEEKVIWRKWNKHDHKFTLLTCIPIFIAFIGYSGAFGIYMMRFKAPYLSAQDLYMRTKDSYNFKNPFTHLIVEPAFFIGLIVIEAIIILLFSIISRIIMKRPDIMKQIIISVNLETQLIDIQLQKVDSKKIVLEKSYAAREFIDYICNPKTNEIILDNVPYLIGTDKKKDIFSKEELKRYGIVHMPTKKLTTIESVSKIVELMRGVERCFDQKNRIYIDSYR